jgi:hypothetical protein
MVNRPYGFINYRTMEILNLAGYGNMMGDEMEEDMDERMRGEGWTSMTV